MVKGVKYSALKVLIGFLFISHGSYSFCGNSSSLLSAAKQKIGRMADNIKRGVQNAAKHLLSWDGVKDISTAYLLGMILTAMHELGHAMASKLLYGTPLNVVIGASSRSGHRIPFFSVGGIAVAGFNPATGYAKTYDHGAHPFYGIAILLAGPISGALASAAAYVMLKKYVKKFYMTKFVSLYGLFNHIIGRAGLAGLWIPRSDLARVYNIIAYQL